MQIAQYKFIKNFYFAFLQKLSIMFHSCLYLLQIAQVKKWETKRSWHLIILKIVNFFDHNFSMDNKRPLNLASEGNHYFHVTVDQFSVYIITVPTPKTIVQYAVYAIIHHWISEFSHLQYLITDRRAESFNFEIANCWNLFSNRYSPRISDVPWTTGLVEVREKTWNPSESVSKLHP